MSKWTKMQREAYRVYVRKGADGVYDLANERGITDWRNCLPCDAETPVEGGECLVCGTRVREDR